MSVNSHSVSANSLNYSARNDVRRQANPIRRDAGMARRESEMPVPSAIWASAASRGTRVTPMPAATICTRVCRLLASNCARAIVSPISQTASA